MAGPVYVEDNQIFVTNKESNEVFTPSIQITVTDIQDIEYYDREMLADLEDAKGHIVLDFVDTTAEAPGTFTLMLVL